MRKIDRLKAKKAELEASARKALQSGSLTALHHFRSRIAEVEAQIAEAELYEPQRLSDLLSDDVMLRDDIYRKLLKCSLAADFLNDCMVDVREVLKKNGLDDFSFRKDMEDIVRLTQNVAQIAMVPGNKYLEEMIVDNAEFVDACHEAAHRHLAEKLNM